MQKERCWFGSYSNFDAFFTLLQYFETVYQHISHSATTRASNNQKAICLASTLGVAELPSEEAIMYSSQLARNGQTLSCKRIILRLLFEITDHFCNNISVYAVVINRHLQLQFHKVFSKIQIVIDIISLKPKLILEYIATIFFLSICTHYPFNSWNWYKYGNN